MSWRGWGGAAAGSPSTRPGKPVADRDALWQIGYNVGHALRRRSMGYGITGLAIPVLLDAASLGPGAGVAPPAVRPAPKGAAAS